MKKIRIIAVSLLIAPHGASSTMYATGIHARPARTTQPCVFCNIIAGTEPAVVLYENDKVIAFEKKPPHRPVSCLIVPKKHIENIKYISPTDAPYFNAMLLAAQHLGRRLAGSGDFKLLINNGPHADQTVSHLHMHFTSPESWRAQEAQ